MELDIFFFIFALIGFIGGVLSVPVGGSFLFIIPAFLFMGLNGLEAILLGRILLISCFSSANFHFFFHHKFDWKPIFYFLSGNLVGFLLAAKLITSLDIDTVTKIVPWVLLGGSVLLIKDFKVKNPKHQKLIYYLLPLFGLFTGFYGGLGGGKR